LDGKGRDFPGFAFLRLLKIMMDNRFEPGGVEARIAKAWEDAGAFRAGRAGRENADPFCIVIPPPNVTGSLHIGHALNNTLQDVLCRYWRMKGRDVLWQPGTDHAGIATQMMVERKLAADGKPGRRELGREKFLEEVWAWKEQSGGAIVNQLKRLGASCDWSRERFTMGVNGAPDEQMMQAVTKVFVDLHKKGLIYKDRRLVNWDPKLLTAISDLEVEQREIKGHMWYFNYPLEGAVYDPEDDRTFITIATTRPETMLGDGAVAVHPENERLGWMIGKQVMLPLVNRLIPIIADSYADPEKGTGAVKITAAHDFNDYEVGKRHNVPLINLMNADATMVSEQHMPAQYRGLDRYECRKRVVADLEALNLVAKIEPHTHMVPHGDRSGVVIEPWLTDQWYVDVKPLAERALAAVRDGRTSFVPKEREKIYFQWLENIEPWCISRQLWWGHQIPAWYGPDKHVFVAMDEGGAMAQALAHYGQEQPLTRDPDVLDTWFSSALWPFSTMGWPQKTPELAKYYPTATLVTGADIIFFWVARMMMMGLEFMDDVPFRDVIIHGLVRDAKGKKMSKTTGNVIDPLDLIDKYGADALRFTLAAMTAQGKDVKLDEKRVEGYRNFATKIWNAARFAEMNGCARVSGFDPHGVQQTLTKWVLGEAAKAAADIAAAIEAYRYNEAADAAYRFVWGVFCDWYLELAKPVLQGEEASPAERAETQATAAFVLDQIAAMLHPFMPFLTEELWAIKGEEGPARAALLCLSEWPELAGLENAAAEAEIGFIVDLVSEIRSVRAEANVPGAEQVKLVLVAGSQSTKDAVARWNATILRLARASEISLADTAPAQSAIVVVRGESVAMPLAGLIDIGAEKARLQKEAARLEADIAGTERKLANADFVARAPEEVVEENRERIRDAGARRTKVLEALARLG
jgi:valyl-tRNA synthetase